MPLRNKPRHLSKALPLLFALCAGVGWLEAGTPVNKRPLPHSEQGYIPSVSPRAPWGMGDVNRDGRIDASDIVLVILDFGCERGRCVGDAQCDGVTDLWDLLVTIENYGTKGENSCDGEADGG